LPRKILHVDDAALPRGTTLAVADLFLTTRTRKFLSQINRVAHVTASRTTMPLLIREALRIASASHNIISAPPVARNRRADLPDLRKETLSQLLPWRRNPYNVPDARASTLETGPEEPARDPGSMRLSAFTPSPELQKLNRNSIYIFINKRIIRDRLHDARDHRSLPQRNSPHIIRGLSSSKCLPRKWTSMFTRED